MSIENLNDGRSRNSGEYAEAYLAAKATLENQRKELMEKINNPGNVRKEIFDELLTDVNNQLIKLDIDHQVGNVPKKNKPETIN